MGQLPQLGTKAKYSLNTTTFRGLNHSLACEDGQMYDMSGMSGDMYPMLSARNERGMVRPVIEPQAMIAKDKLMWIEGDKLYYDGQEVPGVQMQVSRSMAHQMVSMGAYVCIWPEGIWLNTATAETTEDGLYMEHGHMGARWENAGAVSLTMCRQDGADYGSDEITKAAEAPEEPSNGDYWLDTSGDQHILKRWNQGTEEWVTVLTTYVRIEARDLGAAFERDDGVTISGLHTDDQEIRGQVEHLNADSIVLAKGQDWIVVVGLLDKAVSVTGSIAVERKVPQLQYVTESENRLWGCSYYRDEETGQLINEIRACKLGDFKNWNYYAGLSIDSYAVSVGTDGEFTGCGTLKNYPTFFKENCLHMIAGSQPSQYTMKTIKARGVQPGSWQSVAVVGEMMYYKATTGVMAWDGSVPVDIGEPLGRETMYEACGGANGEKYMISMRDRDLRWSLYEYDTSKGLWHRTRGIRASHFSQIGDECWYFDHTLDWIVAANGTVGEKEGRVTWEATFGIVGFESEEQKYLSRFNLRLGMQRGCEVQMWMQYDSDGEWHKMGEILGRQTTTYLVPVIPRRCDHCQLRLTGKGPVKIFGIARQMELGGDGKWHG